MRSTTPDVSRAGDSARVTSQLSRKGILAAPDRFGGYARAASVFRTQGRVELADRALRKALLIAPDEPRLHVNAANLWLSTEVSGDSARALRRALCLDPLQSAAIQRLLLIYRAMGDAPGAIKASGQLIAASPEHRAVGLLELATLVNDAGDQRRARRLLDDCLRETIRSARDPGNLILAAGRIGGEEIQTRVLRSLICASPIDQATARALAAMSDDVERAETARAKALLSRLCLAFPDIPAVQNSAGALEERRGRNDLAIRRYMRAAVLDPGLAVAIFNTGVHARYAGNFHKARLCFNRALAIEPANAIFRYNLGHVLLATGGAEQGLALYEERWRSGQRPSHRRSGPNPSFPISFLKTIEQPDKDDTVLIWGEQGIGDEIWFAGFAPDLFTNRKTILECDPRLVDLFKRSGLATSVVPRTDPPHARIHDARWQVAAGSLPFLARARTADEGRSTPRRYLTADTNRATTLRARLAGLGKGPAIGISWRSRKRLQDRSFEAPLACLGPVLTIPGAVFVNLQYDASDQEIAEIEARFGVTLTRFQDVDPLLNIDDLAALISGLDHVVSIANVNVTLCHGLGRPCHVALRHYQEDWRFQRDRAHSPWLPDCRLYWPKESKDPETAWKEVFARIAATLEVHSGAGKPMTPPDSQPRPV